MTDIFSMNCLSRFSLTCFIASFFRKIFPCSHLHFLCVDYLTTTSSHSQKKKRTNFLIIGIDPMSIDCLRKMQWLRNGIIYSVSFMDLLSSFATLLSPLLPLNRKVFIRLNSVGPQFIIKFDLLCKDHVIDKQKQPFMLDVLVS